jgi:imidazole glycerol-phosphate synthase subunit HisF
VLLIMYRTRVIPSLLLKNQGLVKTVKFKNPTYLGDPINVVRIFNDKEVDELVLLDIAATTEQRKPNFDLIARIAGECFMPLGYGGGIRCLEDIRRLLAIGIEKVIINSYAVENSSFIRTAADEVGSQSVVVSIDVKKSRWGKQEIVLYRGTKGTGLEPAGFVREMAALGAGEILLNSVDRDGTMQGYDLDLINRVSQAVNIPVVACGGAGSVQDLVRAVNTGGASAAAAGSLFVFQGRHRAVLISYPDPKELQTAFES